MKKIKPCPFCGGKPMIFHAPNGYGVTCKNHGCIVIVSTGNWGTEESAIAAWNQRKGEQIADTVQHGRWIGCDTQCGIACSVCGTPVDDFCHSIDYIGLTYEPKYCPNCGTKVLP